MQEIIKEIMRMESQRAAPAGQAGNMSPQEQLSTAAATVRGLYHDLLAAWNRREASAFAGLFWADGYAVGFDGSTHNNAKQLESDLQTIFAGHPTGAYVGIVREVRFITDDVALLRAAAGMIRPGETDIHPPVNAIQTLIATRRNGKWQISVFQNTPAAFHGRPELAEQLTAELRAAHQSQD